MNEDKVRNDRPFHWLDNHRFIVDSAATGLRAEIIDRREANVFRFTIEELFSARYEKGNASSNGGTKTVRGTMSLVTTDKELIHNPFSFYVYYRDKAFGIVHNAIFTYVIIEYVLIDRYIWEGAYEAIALERINNTTDNVVQELPCLPNLIK